MVINGQRAKFGTEITIDATTFTGSFQAMNNSFADSPLILIIQNDTNQTVSFSDDGGLTSGLSLIAGTKLAIDMSANKGPLAATFGFSKGMTPYVSATIGAGLFKVAYLYAT